MLVVEKKKKADGCNTKKKGGRGRNIFFKVFYVLIVYCVTSWSLRDVFILLIHLVLYSLKKLCVKFLWVILNRLTLIWHLNTPSLFCLLFIFKHTKIKFLFKVQYMNLHTSNVTNSLIFKLEYPTAHKEDFFKIYF